MAKSSKHRVVYDHLLREITAGKFARDGKLPSEMQLVRRFKMSRPTVARALQDLRNAGLLDRKVGSGTYLRSAMPATATKLLGLLVPGLGNTEILDPVCTEITRVAEQSGFAVLWGDPLSDGSNSADAEALCRQYLDRHVAGVFFAPLELPPDRDAINRRLVSMLHKANTPVVLLDRDLEPFPARSNLDLVGIDNFAAGYVLTQHLLEHGCRRLVFFAKPQFPSTTDQRLAGCREAVARFAAPDYAATISVMIADPSDSAVAGQLRATDPDAVICSNDLTAALLIRTLTAAGVSVPKDLRVVGFDDVRYATLLATPLTTMRLPCRDLGKAAVQTMLERIKDPKQPGRQILLRAELVVRQSCGTTL